MAAIRCTVYLTSPFLHQHAVRDCKKTDIVHYDMSTRILAYVAYDVWMYDAIWENVICTKGLQLLPLSLLLDKTLTTHPRTLQLPAAVAYRVAYDRIHAVEKQRNILRHGYRQFL